MSTFMTPSAETMIERILTAETDNFVELAKLAGLDPARAYIGADLTHCDLRGCKLAGFNFSGADLRWIKVDDATDFTNAVLTGARFNPKRIKGIAIDTGPQDRTGRRAFSKAAGALARDAREGVIPTGVYWSREAGNFYDATTNRGMGLVFYDLWESRKDEFPVQSTTSPRGLDLDYDKKVRPRDR